MNLNYKTIGTHIKIHRKMKNVTQEQMAEALNLSVGFISQLERGICKVSLDTLANIIEYLDCSFTDILEDSNKENDGYKLAQLNALYMSMSPDDQRIMYRIMEAYVNNK